MNAFLVLLALGGGADLESNRSAIETVERAVAARGKELVPLAIEVNAKVVQIHQSRTPDGPYLETTLDRRLVVDAAARSAYLDDTSVWPYFTSRTTLRIQNDEIATIRHSSRSHSSGAGGAARRTSIARQHPDLVLDAASRRRASLRSGGPSAVSFASEDGTVMTLTFRDEKLSSVDWLSYHELFGDVAHRFAYEWAGNDPVSFRYLENGRVVMHGTYRELARGADAVVPSLEIPADFSKSAEGPPAPVAIVPLADGVSLVRNAGGPDYHSLLVDLGDHFVVAEAPRSTTTAKAAIAAIRAHDPLKPIRAVVVTHHHDDHIGGIRAYAATGARIVTTAGNVAYLRRILTAPHTIERATSIKPDVIGVASGHRLAGGGRELLLFDAGPNEHVKESLVAWLPAARVIFQGDLFRLDPAGAEAARESGVAFREFIRKQKLDVLQIVGTHGEAAALSDLDAAIARRDADKVRR